MTQVRRLVCVSGVPGAATTSLAGPLAAELGYALIALFAVITILTQRREFTYAMSKSRR